MLISNQIDSENVGGASVPAGHSALIFGGGSSLGRAVALELARWGITLGFPESDGPPSKLALEALHDAGGDARIVRGPKDDVVSLIAAADGQLGGLTILVNLYIPDPASGPGPVLAYPGALLERGLAAAPVIARRTRHGAIVNHCFMPSMYAGTALEDYLPALKGGVTGVTRTLCRRFGRDGVRINCVQTGLLDLTETREAASSEVLGTKVPVGRWGKAEDVAKLVAFLALKNRYMTGQVVIIDGGLTAGQTGT
jgi:NAD(P)-dependent dehydrogenase (short-subunit alcohol dehydrogenase family)